MFSCPIKTQLEVQTEYKYSHSAVVPVAAETAGVAAGLAAGVAAVVAAVVQQQPQ